MFNFMKKKREKIMSEFREDLKNYIESFHNREDYFRGLYEIIMEKHGVDKKHADSMFSTIPDLKKQFLMICDRLVELSQHNCCLCSAEKVEELKSANLISQEKIITDSIEILPVLADYFEIYHALYTNIYDDLLTHKFVLHINGAAFAFLLRKESDYASKDDYQKMVDTWIGFIDFGFNLEVDTFIRNKLGLDKNVDVRNSSDSTVIDFLNISKEAEFFNSFVDVWFTEMQKIGRTYGKIQLELYKYFTDINERLKQHFSWFSIHGHYFDLAPYMPSLKENTKAECMRVLELYKRRV